MLHNSIEYVLHLALIAKLQLVQNMPVWSVSTMENSQNTKTVRGNRYLQLQVAKTSYTLLSKFVNDEWRLPKNGKRPNWAVLIPMDSMADAELPTAALNLLLTPTASTMLQGPRT
jgi:hypothetical protein